MLPPLLSMHIAEPRLAAAQILCNLWCFITITKHRLPLPEPVTISSGTACVLQNAAVEAHNAAPDAATHENARLRQTCWCASPGADHAAHTQHVPIRGSACG